MRVITTTHRGVVWRLTRLLCGLLAALAPAAAMAAQPMVFQNLSQEDGLSQGTVNASLQDSHGFMWFATENGLNRYDGYTVLSYTQNRNDPDALGSDFIWDIEEDAAGDLWLATEGSGLVRWRRRQERFETVLSAETLAAEPALRLARSVHVDSRERVWVGTRGAGIVVVDRDGREVRRLRHDPADPRSLASDTVSVIAPATGGGVWLGSDAGLDRVHPESGELRRVLGGPAQPVAVSSLAVDHDGRLWVGSFESGVYRRAAPGGEFQRLQHSPEDPASLSNDRVRAITADRAGRIWVATEDGLNLYRGGGRFARYSHDDSDRYSLASNRLMSITEDRGGLLWIGSRNGGVDRWNPRSWSLGSQRPELLSGATLMAFADAGEGEVWVGSIGAPLSRFDRDGRFRASFTPDHGYPDIGAGPATALLRDSAGRLWIGSMGEGLRRFDPATGELVQLRHEPDEPASLGADGIMTLFEDSRGRIWAGTFGGGLAGIDAATLAVQRHAPDAADPQAISGGRVTAIGEGADGRLWVATDGGGLNVMDPEAGDFRHYRYAHDRASSLGSDTIYSLHVDTAGSVWIGTAGAGLARLRPDQQQRRAAEFETFTSADGLSSNVINGIQGDGAGGLWLSSNSGLMRLDPDSGRVDSFHRVHGLVAEEFNFGAHHRARDGRLYFGSSDGYNAFWPAAVETATQPPALTLTGFEKFNEPAATDVPYADLQQLTLSHADDVITFEYAALDFTAPEKNLYSVKLEGFDRDWSEPSPRHRTTYTNLDAGQYRFRVRAANADGVWTPESLDIDLEVRPAPWATPWAYALYALIIGSLIFVFFRHRLRVMEREARIRQLAYYDKVSGLPNRELFEIRTEDAIKGAVEAGESLDVISLRIDPVQQLGDTLGHRSMDDVMRLLTTRISQAFFGAAGVDARRDLARLNDTTLVAFVRYGPEDMDGMAWARKLTDAAAAPLVHGRHRVSVETNAGVASFGRDAVDVARLVTYAGTAANDAARDPRSRFLHYQRAMTVQAMERISLEGELRAALDADQLELYLQGKFSPQGELVGAEALCRWQHPVRGAISPGVFVPLAEESGLIRQLDRWVIGQACALLHHLQERGQRMLSLAVNVSADTFTSGEILDILAEQSARYSIDPAYLELEITESVMVRNVDQVIRTLAAIKRLGYTLSLDDFGTGYSSLTYLQRFPVDKIKIDQSFVRGLEDRPDQRAMCTAIIGLARSLGLKTVAEGVENLQQLQILSQLGCDQLQGFELHRPQPARAFLDEYRWRGVRERAM